MYEFQWQLPTPQSSTVTLRVHTRKDWFGIKTLHVDGRRIYRRYWLAGVSHRFAVDGSAGVAELNLVESGAHQWRPVLLYNGQELPEELGTAPPQLSYRPPIISVVTGVTYLLMLVAVVMLLSITDMLETLKQPHAGRKYVLTVRDPELPSLLSVESEETAAVAQGEKLDRQMRARGGTPPYEWTPSDRHWPKGMTLDPLTGEVSFTAHNPNDYLAEFTVGDARGELASGALAVVVDPTEPPPSGWPTITTTNIPDAAYGQAYEACLQLDLSGDQWRWSRLSGTLPKGVNIATNGCLAGTPQRRELGVLAKKHADTLRAGTIDADLAADLLNAKVRMGKNMRLLPVSDRAPDVRVLADDERRLILDISSDGVHVYDGGDQYGFTATVVDSSYTAGDDIRPWVFPFLATAVSLLGYWNMRRWGVILLGVLIAAQVVCILEPLVPVSVTAVVLEFLIWVVGLANYGRMR
ncbi:MAG TPA: hypothetical protein P5572_02950 [Phycisphaerae bacterium]|nr:hypothetical protein [Phycisphaerales bacterium]HRX83958.1 hypothetical protein [Phycisphaerae bacterium]